MSKCNRCNIEILDDSLICPLCKGALSDAKPARPAYPDMLPKLQRMRLALRIVAFCAIVGSLVLGIVNYLTYRGVKWSLVSVAAIVYLYLTFAVTVQPLSDEQEKILFQGIISMALALAVDFSLGYRGWSVNIAIPVVMIVVDVVFFVMMLVRRRDWRSYVIPQIELTLLAAVLLLLVSMDVVTRKALAMVAVFVIVVQLFGVFLIGGRSTTLELNRRFRM
ncbi:MAG: DUF6320 domain-containing protein [Wujia sp.]